MRKLGVRSPISSPEVPSSVVDGNRDHHGYTNSSNHNDRSDTRNSSFSENHITSDITTPPKNNTLMVMTGRKTEQRRRRRYSGSTHDTAVMAVELRKTRSQVEEMTQELARTKLEYAEAMVGVEQKKMEARQALLREAQAIREVDTARSYIAILEQKVRLCIIINYSRCMMSNVMRFVLEDII